MSISLICTTLLEYLLPQRLVADNDTGRNLQFWLSVAAIRTDVGLSGKIMVSVYDQQLVIVAGVGSRNIAIPFSSPYDCVLIQ